MAYPELGEILSDPGLVCSEDRVRCGSRLEELKERFPLIKGVFVE